MNAESVAILRSLHGQPIPLQGVSLSARAEGLLFELTVEQRYANAESQAIEAIYTFPLPLRAVLLSFELAIGGKKLKGVVSAKRAAAEKYENALDAGHSAALLEHAGDGLYTVNLGNLLPGESATITYRYAQLLDYEQGRVRLAIPTALAPRYGAPDLDPHQVPQTDITVRYPCTFALELRGALASARIGSPTHGSHLDFERLDGVTLVRARRTFGLDRDLVVLVEDLPSLTQAVVARDGDGYVAVASLVAPTSLIREATPRSMKLVVDCSGSMQGDSIAQARTALLGVLQGLDERDRVSLTRFGNSHQHLTAGLEQASAHTLGRLGGLVRKIEADLGGTEMQGALRAVLALPAGDTRADVLLITDGEIWEVDAVVEEVARAHHRLFVVAVGAAPNEALARKIADVTGGACEFVTPNEDMRDAVARLLVRMGTPPTKVERVDWPRTAQWTLGQDAVVFAGDTVHVLAAFATQPVGEVRVVVGGGAVLSCMLPAQAAADDALARVAAMRRLRTLAREEAAALAERHQLVTEYTSCVVVLERATGEQAEGMPSLRTVPHELAAGWGGTGTVLAAATALPSMSRKSVLRAAPAGAVCESAAPLELSRFESPRARDIAAGVDDLGDVPAFLRRPGPPPDALASRLGEQRPAPTTLDELRTLGVDERVLAALREIVDTGVAEADVVAAWLAEFLDGAAGQALGFRTKLRLRRAADRGLRRIVAERLAATALA